MSRLELPITIPGPSSILRARKARREEPAHAPEPPDVPFPQADVARIAGLGELFFRDSGPGSDGRTIVLLHGWTATADLNWYTVYGPLMAAGFRVVALDHRGHGRGLRASEPFRLADCADDAAALLAHLGIDEAIAVGYSMGGPVATLLARRHPQLVSGLILCATSLHWQDPYLKVLWKGLGGLRLLMGAGEERTWHHLLRAAGYPPSPITSWIASETSRGSARAIAEAGREMARYDARPWIAGLGVPSAVIVTERDTTVPTRKQHDLAKALDAPAFVVPGDHFAVSTHAKQFNAGLRKAIDSVQDRARTAVAA